MAYIERDFPEGHPSAVDTVIGSEAHIGWQRAHEFSENKRDFPPGHIKAVDTPGNENHLVWANGRDPRNAQAQEFTGAQPDRARAVAEWNKAQGEGAHESPALAPIDATVANAALQAEREKLRVDALTADQHHEVIKSLQAGK